MKRIQIPIPLHTHTQHERQENRLFFSRWRRTKAPPTRIYSRIARTRTHKRAIRDVSSLSTTILFHRFCWPFAIHHRNIRRPIRNGPHSVFVLFLPTYMFRVVFRKKRRKRQIQSGKIDFLPSFFVLSKNEVDARTHSQSTDTCF